MAFQKKGSSGKMENLKSLIWPIFKRLKLPLIFLAIGLVLMLSPGQPKSEIEMDKTDLLMGKVLSSVQNVGDCIVLISDNGVVIVCEGADKAKVRLEIIQAISSYTGYSSEKITILKMLD